MSIFNIYKLKDLDKRTYRIDSEYYHPEYFIMEHVLYKKEAKPFSFYHPEIIHPAEIKRRYSECGIWFLRAQNVRPLQINKDNSVYLPLETLQILPKNKIKKGDILVTRTGANFGQCAVYLCNEDAIASSHTLIIRASNIDTCFLALYFNTRYGRKFIDRGMYGAAQPEIAPYFIKQILIPNISEEFQEIIRKKYLKSYSSSEESTALYTQAEQLLLSELGLQDWKPARALTFVRSYSQVARAGRMDAEYFHPKYDGLRERIRQYPNGFLRITDIAVNSDETVEPTAHAEDDYRYIELADINQVIGTIESANEIKGKDAPSRARMLLRAGDVIASTVEGSLDKVALVSEEYHGAIGSTGFFVLRPRTVQSGYLLALVKSIIVREQMRCESSGTILAAVPAKSLRNIIVPNIPPEKRDEITQLVQQSHAARREAKALLEKAKRAVEIAIEEGEDKAIEFLNIL